MSNKNQRSIAEFVSSERKRKAEDTVVNSGDDGDEVPASDNATKGKYEILVDLEFEHVNRISEINWFLSFDAQIIATSSHQIDFIDIIPKLSSVQMRIDIRTDCDYDDDGTFHLIIL